MIQKEIYIGDKSKFAIRFAHDWESDNDKKFAYCHLILNGQLIGDKEEICYLATWLGAANRLMDRIKNQFELFKNDEFINKTDEEVFELIHKANQLEDEYDPQFSYLPVLKNEVWSYCNINLDETIDAYLITMTEINGAIKFIWKGWRSPCPDDKIGKLFAVTIDRNFVIEIFEKCFQIIEEEKRN